MNELILIEFIKFGKIPIVWLFFGLMTQQDFNDLGLGLRNFLDIETETHRDWEISWMSRPRLFESGKFNGCWDRDQSRLGKRCWYWDSIETLADLWHFLSCSSQLKITSCGRMAERSLEILSYASHLPLRFVFYQMSFFIKSCLHWRLSSIEVIFYRRLSSIQGCLPYHLVVSDVF